MLSENQIITHNALTGLFNYWKSIGIQTSDGLSALEFMGAPLMIDGQLAPAGNWETHINAKGMCDALKNGYDHGPSQLANFVNGGFDYNTIDILEGVRDCCPDITEEEVKQIRTDLGIETDEKLVAIKNKDGNYFGFKANNPEPYWGSSNRIGGYEKLYLIHNDSGTYTFKNKDGNYFGFKTGNDPDMWASAERIGGYEELHMTTNANGTVAFSNKDGDYFGFKADNNPSIWGSSNRIGGYEELSIEYL